MFSTAYYKWLSNTITVINVTSLKADVKAAILQKHKQIKETFKKKLQCEELYIRSKQETRAIVLQTVERDELLYV